MNSWISALLTAWFGVLGSVQAEFFTSIGHMTDLIYAEQDLVRSLKEYILIEEAKISKIKRCLTFCVPMPSWLSSPHLH